MKPQTETYIIMSEERTAVAARFQKRAEVGGAIIGGFSGAWAGALASAASSAGSGARGTEVLNAARNGAVQGAVQGVAVGAEAGAALGARFTASRQFDEVLTLFQPAARAERRRRVASIDSEQESPQQHREARRMFAVSYLLQQLERARSAAPTDTPSVAPPTRIQKLTVCEYVPVPGEEEDCCICLDTLCAGDLTRRLPCGHKAFHQSCIDEWLGQGAAVCPMCRSEV